MLWHQLIRSIEAHSDAIMTRVVMEIHSNAELSHLRALPEFEIREWGCRILKNLGDWLVTSRDGPLEGRYENLGRLRFKEMVPLCESVRGLQVVKEKALDFIREQGFAQSAAEIYAEEELEHLIHRFFDRLAYYLVRGYESALRLAARMAA